MMKKQRGGGGGGGGAPAPGARRPPPLDPPFSSWLFRQHSHPRPRTEITSGILIHNAQ